MKSLILIISSCFWVFTGIFAQNRPSLLPEPTSIQYRNGALAVSNVTFYVPPTASKDIVFALKELQQTLSERSGKPVKTASTLAASRVRYTVKTTGRELPETDEATKGSTREHYSLSVSAQGIRIEAETSTGLWYAVQTLRQLIQGEGQQAAIPYVTITDRPTMAFRGVMMDFAHGGLLTVEEIKRQIDFLARWKTNQYYFYNEVSIELEGYSTLNYKANYSQEEVKSIIAYARERHMDVIPFVNFYGHLHELIRNEKYASLAIGRYGHEMDPRNAGVRELLKNWIKQYTSLFKSPFIHVGFDETWETKRLNSTEEKSLNPEALYIQQLTFVSEELKKYGKTLLAWTDMSSFYPDIIKKFPADVIPVIWQYSPDSAATYHYLNPVLKEKRPFFIQPAVSGWGHIYPEAGYTYDNIDLCLRAGLRHQTLGFITSVWTDSVEPFVRSSWMFMAYGCISAWQGKSPNQKEFSRKYASLVYPNIAQEMGDAFENIATSVEYLKKCLGKNTQSMPRGTLVEAWSNPFSAYYLANTEAHMADFREVRKYSEEAQANLIAALKKASKTESEFANSLLVSARLINYSAMRFMWARTVVDRWDYAMVTKKKEDYVIYDLTYPCHSLLVDAMDETGELKREYEKAWLSECMPYRLNSILGRFDVEYSLWRKLHLKVVDFQIQRQKDAPVKSFIEVFNPDF